MLSDTGVAVGVLTLAGTLLGVVVTSTWRFSSLATKLTETISHLQVKATELEKKDEELKQKYQLIDKIPNIEFRLDTQEKLLSNIPNVISRVTVLEARAEFSKELRQSKPKIGI